MKRVISSLVTITQSEFSPQFNEFDTIGVIVHIGTHYMLKQIECVYIADVDQNIVAIKFWKSVKDFCDAEVIKVKNIVYIKNLQWSKQRSEYLFTEAYSNERTLFELDPCGFGNDVNLQYLIDKCKHTIEMLSMNII